MGYFIINYLTVMERKRGFLTSDHLVHATIQKQGPNRRIRYTRSALYIRGENATQRSHAFLHAFLSSIALDAKIPEKLTKLACWYMPLLRIKPPNGKSDTLESSNTSEGKMLLSHFVAVFNN